MNEAFGDRPAPWRRPPVELCGGQLGAEFSGQTAVLAELRLMLGQFARERFDRCHNTYFLEDADVRPSVPNLRRRRGIPVVGVEACYRAIRFLATKPRRRYGNRKPPYARIERTMK